MKEFHGDIIYRGCSMQIRFTAKSVKEAAQKLNVSTYYIRKYVCVIKTDKNYKEIFAKAYGYRAKICLGKKKEYQLSDAKKVIDKYIDNNIK
jgi:hypothetical protein